MARRRRSTIGYPVINRNVAETEFALQIVRELVGDEHVIAQAVQLMSSEDIAYMLEQRPGCFLRLGNDVDEDDCMIHNPAYDFSMTKAYPLEPLIGRGWLSAI